MKSRGCWTCKNRRVACDRTHPKCLNCTRTQRKCGGYAIRFSWRNTLSTPASSHLATPQRHEDLRLVHIKAWDIELHRRLSMFSGVNEVSDQHNGYTTEPHLQRPLSWSPFHLDTDESELLRYFESTASHSLATLSSDRGTFRGVLFRLALWANTASSRAVLKALLALASLHRYGMQPQAMLLKGEVLKGLKTSLRSTIGWAEGVQHVAAGMLLCSFDVQGPAKPGEYWGVHVCGAMHMINYLKLASFGRTAEFSSILDWLYYSEVMTKFSLRHWRNARARLNKPAPRRVHEVFMLNIPPLCDLERKLPKSDPSISSHGVLKVLAEVFDSLLVPEDPQHYDEQHLEHLQSLKVKLKAIGTTCNSARNAGQTSHEFNMSRTVHLFSLAGLVYLERASRNFSGQSVELDSWVNRAFTILADLDSFELPFPLFIFGCEARIDERRMVILDLFERTKKVTRIRNLEVIEGMVQAIWAQDDLETERELDYAAKINGVISLKDQVPAFA